MVAEAMRLSSGLDAAIAVLRRRSEEEAEAEREYRKARARGWVTHSDGTAKQREDDVNATTADLRYQRDLKAGLRQSSLEAVRSLRAQISLLQSVLNAYKAEAEFARTGPQ